MPELPEVETVRAGLARRVLGRTVADVEVRHPRAVRHQQGGAGELRERLVGRSLSAAVRRGKFLWFLLDEPDAQADPPPGQGEAPPGQGDALLAHLGMSGQLLVQGEGDRPADLTATLPPTTVRPVPLTAAHLRVRLVFDDGGELWFVDQRTFGHVTAVPLLPTPDGGAGGFGSPAPVLPVPVAHIARDLLDPALDRENLVRRLRARRTEVKRALLDQTLVSGVGNIYADEALWRARLHGTRPTDRLRPDRVRLLLDAATDVMREALAVGGTSFDALYVDVEGASGWFARSLAVYGRAGEPCPRCGAPVRREHFMNRSSYSCPRCQRRPARGASRTSPGSRLTDATTALGRGPRGTGQFG